MASPFSIAKLNPFKVVIIFLVLVILIFLSSIIPIVLFSYGERSRIIEYEFQTILRGNGAYLEQGDVRKFVNILSQNSFSYLFEALDNKTHQIFRSGHLNDSPLIQCTSDTYLQYTLKFCRPFEIPIKTICLLGFTFFIFFILLVFSTFKASKLIVLEFEKLFTFANIPYSGKLSFSKSWVIAQEMASLFKKFQFELLQNERNKTSFEISTQVAHDIRSPLAALKMLLTQLDTIPEDKRILIRSSVNRINDIANDLLNHGKKNAIDVVSTDISLENSMLATLVDSVVSEKRISTRDRGGVQIEARLDESYGLFSLINPIEVKRLLSNAITNAVEAFEGNQGLVEVILKSTQDKVILTVKDNGKGIPPNILEKLGTQGVTHGKEGTQSGSGLGVYHAKKTIESLGGKYEISSILGQGTSIIMTLKKEIPPDWFVQRISISKNQTIVATDDDSSILEIWKHRFSNHNESNSFQLVTCSSGADLTEWVSRNYENSKNALYLLDFEFLGQNKNGLDLIVDLNLNQNAILVSSRYEESQIKERCSKLGIKMIPKGMASLVPIEIELEKLNLDYVLIDDDIELVQALWKFRAKENNKNILCFSDEANFLKIAPEISLNTPIYIDVNLANGINGIEVAKRVHKMGFKNINLATGYEASSINKPDFINSVTGKDFPLI